MRRRKVRTAQQNVTRLLRMYDATASDVTDSRRTTGKSRHVQEGLSSPSCKNISLPFFRTVWFPPAIPPRQRGVRVVTNVEAGCGGRWSCRKTSDAVADGKAAWSWPPDAEAKFASL